MSKCYICKGYAIKGDSITLNDHIIDSSEFPLCIEHKAEVSRWLAQLQENLGSSGGTSKSKGCGKELLDLSGNLSFADNKRYVCGQLCPECEEKK